MGSSKRCIGCDSSYLRALDNRALPRGVASDSKPWPRCGEFVICEECGHTQKIQDETWCADVAQIYNGYEMYFLSGGSDQLVFDGAQPVPRIQRLFEKLCQRVSLPARGKMLDVGCAIGSTLRTFNSLFPRWELAGFDITTHSEATVRAIPGVTDFYSGSLDDITQQYDLVTMLFVVEHLPEPRQVLDQFRRLLKPGGLAWIHTSDFWTNPFDLTVVDHSSHFMVDTLAEMVERSGFEVIDRNDNWNIKEIGVMARLPEAAAVGKVDQKKKAERLLGAPRRLSWLGDLVDQVRAKAERARAGGGKLGVLGTSIAATWLANMLPAEVAFFVDEDRQRVGKMHMGRPVITPQEVRVEDPVVLAFPTFQAEKIQAKLLKLHPRMDSIVPPPLAA